MRCTHYRPRYAFSNTAPPDLSHILALEAYVQIQNLLIMQPRSVLHFQIRPAVIRQNLCRSTIFNQLEPPPHFSDPTHKPVNMQIHNFYISPRVPICPT